MEVLRKYHETDSVKDRPRPGRKRKIPKEDEKRIIKKAKLKKKPATEIAREYEKETGTELHPTTIQRLLHRHNLRWLVEEKTESLSEVNQAKRLAYAEKMRNQNWRRVLFTDEKSFHLGTFVSHSWQEPGKRKTRSVTRHPPKLHVWAGAGYYTKAKLYFFTENLTAKLYRRILTSQLPEKHLIYAPDCPSSFRAKWTFMQDNDPKHKAHSTMQFLRERFRKRIIEHPSQSPDLNILEDIWSYLDRKVKAADVKSIDALKRRLKKEWLAMPWSELRKSIDSMPARLAECEQLQGARTHY
jgi:hypothetical protein